MPRAKRQPKMSREEILLQAAQLVAQTIDPEPMGMTPDEVPLEKFIQFFIEKADEMLKQNGRKRLHLAIGPYMNRENTLYTEDLVPIINYIEERTQLKFCFFNGIIVDFGTEDIGAGWIPDRPF